MNFNKLNKNHTPPHTVQNELTSKPENLFTTYVEQYSSNTILKNVMHNENISN